MPRADAVFNRIMRHYCRSRKAHEDCVTLDSWSRASLQAAMATFRPKCALAERKDKTDAMDSTGTCGTLDIRNMTVILVSQNIFHEFASDVLYHIRATLGNLIALMSS